MSRDFIQVIGAAAALAAVIIAGMALVMSITVAPLREDMRSLRTEMQRGFEVMSGEITTLRQDMNNEFKAVRGEIDSVRGEVNGLRQDMNNEFKAVRSDIAEIRERLTRVETLLERDAGQPAAPVAPDARQ